MRKTVLAVASGLVLSALAIAPALAASSTDSSGPIGSQVLSEGMRGSAVTTLQGDLWQFGFNPGPADGFFSWKTRAALVAFQKGQGLTPTGTLNQATFEAILTAGGWSASWTAGGSTGTGSSSDSSNGSRGSSSSSSSGSSKPSGQTINMLATAYGPSAQDNYPYGATDYFGQPLKVGDIAVDPRVIPLGSELYICGYHMPGYLPPGCMYGTADDEGGAIKGDHIDIYVNAPDSVLNSLFGEQPVTVTIVKSGTGG